MCDFIHGDNSPLLRVSEKEREKKLGELKRNMTKAFECSLGRSHELLVNVNKHVRVK